MKHKKCLLFAILVVNTQTSVAVISYARYCRYRGLLKRLENVQDKWLKNTLIQSLGGFVPTGHDTRIMFCKVSTNLI